MTQRGRNWSTLVVPRRSPAWWGCCSILFCGIVFGIVSSLSLSPLRARSWMGAASSHRRIYTALDGKHRTDSAMIGQDQQEDDSPQPLDRRATSSASRATSVATPFLSLQFSLWKGKYYQEVSSVHLHLAVSRALLQILCTETPQLSVLQQDSYDQSIDSVSEDVCQQFAPSTSPGSRRSTLRRQVRESSFLQTNNVHNEKDAALFRSERLVDPSYSQTLVQSKEKGPPLPGSESTDVPTAAPVESSPTWTSSGKSIILSDPYMAVQDKTENDRSWMVWSVAYKVMQVGDYYIHQVDGNPSNTSDSASSSVNAVDGTDLAALEVMRQMVQAAVDVSLTQQRFDAALEQYVGQPTRSCPVGQEAVAFAGLPADVAVDASNTWSPLRITGIVVFVCLILACSVFVVLTLQRVPRRYKSPIQDENSTGNDESYEIYIPNHLPSLPNTYNKDTEEFQQRGNLFRPQDSDRMNAPPSVLHLPVGPGGVMDFESSDDDRSALSPTLSYLLSTTEEIQDPDNDSTMTPMFFRRDLPLPTLREIVRRTSTTDTDEVEVDVDTGERVRGISRKLPVITSPDTHNSSSTAESCEKENANTTMDASGEQDDEADPNSLTEGQSAGQSDVLDSPSDTIANRPSAAPSEPMLHGYEIDDDESSNFVSPNTEIHEHEPPSSENKASGRAVDNSSTSHDSRESTGTTPILNLESNSVSSHSHSNGVEAEEHGNEERRENCADLRECKNASDKIDLAVGDTVEPLSEKE